MNSEHIDEVDPFTQSGATQSRFGNRAKQSAGRWTHWLIGAATVFAVFAILMPAKFWRPGVLFSIRENVQIGEAAAWWNHHLDLPERKWDTAFVHGMVYSHFPPAFSFLAAALFPFFGGVPHWFIVLFIVLPVPILAYALFVRRTALSSSGALLAIGFVCGTSALPVLDKTLRECGPYFVNQILATAGILLFLLEYYGKRRIWPAAIGVTIASLSRQLSMAYLIPLGWMMLSPRTCGVDSNCLPDLTRRRIQVGNTAIFVSMSLIILGTAMTLNALKFGSPFDSGYRHVYEGRTDDVLARDARAHGIFSPHYVLRNLSYANLGLPELHRIIVDSQPEWYLRPNTWCTGIWWTTPILAFMIIDGRRILRERANQVLFASAGLAYLGLLLYHSTGYEQRGFNRYSLDYVPAVMALIAPNCVASFRRTCTTIALVAWSVLYFAVLLPAPNIRVW